MMSVSCGSAMASATEAGMRMTTCRAGDRSVTRGRSRSPGLLVDLKQRRLLHSTLVVITSRFGRTPWSQNMTGRDRNWFGYSTWLAGGGVVEGAIDMLALTR